MIPKKLVYKPQHQKSQTLFNILRIIILMAELGEKILMM